jgi:hypothetical protein
MTGLDQLLITDVYNAIAIVGMTKNVGKTVTFNYLVEAFEEQSIIPGLISAGYDGERFDRLTMKDKPRIYAPSEALVATAEACFYAAEAELELLEDSTFSTPLGIVVLGRVKKAGLVELAGPGSVSALKELTGKMFSYGSEYVLVDGAINRLASASPLLTDATILATGAALGPTMDDVIRKTLFRKDLLQTERVKEELLNAAKSGLKEGDAALLHRDSNSYHIEPLKATIPLLAGAQLAEKCCPDTEALVFGGALVDTNLIALMEIYSEPPILIVEDATKIFISPEIYYRFLNRGGKINVINPLKLIAVTLNPTDPCGRGYDPKMFLERMTETLQPCPVFDLVHENNKIRNADDSLN